MKVALSAAVLMMLVWSGCNRSKSDTVVDVGDDPRIAEATAEAKQRWPEFVAAYNSRKPGMAFHVKAGFPIRSGPGNEHLWLSVDQITPTHVTGEVNNQVQFDIGLKLGDAVTVPVAEIEDWLYVIKAKNGEPIMTGGFSVKVIEEIQRSQEKR